MKRFLLGALVAFMCGFSVSAQENADKKEENGQSAVELRAQRQSRLIINSLGLAGDTAEEFAELYVCYKEEMLGVKDACPAICHPAKGCGLTDEQIEQNILSRFAQSRMILDIREKYYREFRKILTPGQIQAMYMAEKKNAVCFENQMREHHPQHSAHHPTHLHRQCR